LGTPFTASRQKPQEEAFDLKRARIGLWDRYGGSMPSGWTRWLLERFEFPFQVVFPPELDQGALRDNFDVLIFVDGAIPARPTQRQSETSSAAGAGAEQPAASETTTALREELLPAEYRGRRGSITAAKTIPALRAFLESGGTILTIGTSTNLAQHLDLPLVSHLIEKNEDGKEQPLPREKFFVPGSLLEVRVDNSNPLAWGLGSKADVMFSASPTFKLTESSEGSGEAIPSIRAVAWFDGKTPLRSGWAWGQEHLADGVAVADAKVGAGRLVLFGPQIAFRAQPHGTFKFLFNGIFAASGGE
jgi:hypothetical protein